MVLFGTPMEKETFDLHFQKTHCPLIAKLPKLQASSINYVAGAVIGESPYYIIVELEFNTEQDMQNGRNSKFGQLMARDYSNFASGGVTVLFCNTQN